MLVLTGRAGRCAGAAVEAWLRGAWVRWWDQNGAGWSSVLRWALALEGVANHEADTTVQAWVRVADAEFASEAVEASRADASEEVRSGDLASTGVDAWVGVARVGGSQVDLAAHTAEAHRARAAEGSLAEVASTTVLAKERFWYENNRRFDYLTMETVGIDWVERQQRQQLQREVFSAIRLTSSADHYHLRLAMLETNFIASTCATLTVTTDESAYALTLITYGRCDAHSGIQAGITHPAACARRATFKRIPGSVERSSPRAT